MVKVPDRASRKLRGILDPAPVDLLAVLEAGATEPLSAGAPGRFNSGLLEPGQVRDVPGDSDVEYLSEDEGNSSGPRHRLSGLAEQLLQTRRGRGEMALED